MEYPFWDTGVGYGVLMGAIAIVHVFISHFAIGGGLYLVVMESVARRRGDAQWLGFLERLSRFFVLLTLVFGALTGVGIWFIIGLLNPAATEVLIRNFVWVWAIEWTFFLTEIAAAILYYYGWKRMAPRVHLAVGWVYFAAAWLSLAAINGIVAFMLTPGTWLQTGDLGRAFFNPGYWPSLVLRSGVCIMLAGLYTLLIATRLERGRFRQRVVRVNAAWGLAGLLVMVPGFYWYYHSIPPQIVANAATMLWPSMALGRAYLSAAAVAGLLLLLLLLPRLHHPVVAGALMLSGLVWFGSYEWFRESLRKPYVIGGYMYGNGVDLRRAAEYQRDGYLAHMAWRTGDDGADLFNRACRSCHTIGGYRDIGRWFAGTDPAFIAGIVTGIHRMRGNMPPFYGSAKEAQLLAGHIHQRIDQRHIGEIYGLEGAALGRQVYAARCGGCHEMGGFQDVWSNLGGLDRDDYDEFLDEAGDFADEMPDFTGDPREREALIEYFMQLNRESEGRDGAS